MSFRSWNQPRIVSYETGCRLTTRENRSGPTGPLRLPALCDDVDACPDGVEIVYADRNDDRSCAATTRERTFDELHLLDQRR